ncbi:GIY-YIG nuclease family protein [Microlunatus sp. GCM10028923]|uniref:GIY-YIG nuclease family protein n=1 Tax=Microlunatus sp. GCM10028923 TaxID=3273400 RepID=UPI0036112C9B
MEVPDGLEVISAAAAEAPRRPGVYLFLGEADDILYVGKATDVRQRLRQHAAAKPSDYWLDQKYVLVRRIVWELAADEEAAFWREEELIFALGPAHNAQRRRDGDPATARRSPYLTVIQDQHDRLRFVLTPTLPTAGRGYGCFPHLGKGHGAPLGIACSDGYTALLRLLWAASGEGTQVPATLARSAPDEYAVTVEPALREPLHQFLSGARAKLPTELLDRAANRPAFQQTGLRKDLALARLFYRAGPQRLRERRLRHGRRAGPIDPDTLRALIRAEITAVLDPVG